ncbi:MAG: NADPH:quinone oxidoreductase family protein [Kiritimatiellia bacterium]|jgi:NADPH2:quinone reductase|nr:NADPH:quinone oxidoreductase family protein [Pseudomonadales bacterium]MDP7024057.1 NADPH:quinone oxidoreductase family protein [Kiritimatiellia bacterium]|tara:strand:- start:165 stop:1136 length:972 start_codon:yes stop_codon:yes gene_type:complete
MKAVICEQTGADGYVRYRDTDEPVAGPSQLIVDNRAMSLNFPDLLQIAGLYQIRPKVPFVLGMEYAGVVSAAGEGVTGFEVGERVAGMTYGAFAEKVIAFPPSCYPLPDEVDFDAGAAMTLAGGTALYALRERGALQAGETLAVLGASGGTGSFAVQIGRALGANVIAICSSADKAAAALRAGAGEAVDLSSEDLTDGLKSLTSGHGIDVLYDPVGGEAFEIASRRVAWNGRILTIGYASGTIPQLAINQALIKGYSLVGVHWAAAIRKEVTLARRVIADVFAMYANGDIQPQIDQRYTLAEIDLALDQMRQRKVAGKVIIHP